MSRPEIESGPPAWEASTLEKSHLDSLSAVIRNLYLAVICLRLSGLYKLIFLSSLSFVCVSHRLNMKLDLQVY
jgi:hypothetical protein